jgi:hypothetical protein
VRVSESNNGILPRLKNLERAVNSNRVVPGVGYQVRESTAGTVLDISASGGGTYAEQVYRVKSIAEDDSTLRNILICRTWNGTDEGSVDVPIAKSFECRQPDSEVLLGVTYTYTYSVGGDGINDSRDSDDGTTTETQMVTPLYKVDQEITVKRVNYSGIIYSGQDLKLMESSSRCWAKVT